MGVCGGSRKADHSTTVAQGVVCLVALGQIGPSGKPNLPESRLRKLHGRLRSQLELPRKPSEGCRIGAL